MRRPGPHPWGPDPHGRDGPRPGPHPGPHPPFGPKPPCVKKCLEEIAEVKDECATKMGAIKAAFEAGTITKDQAIAKFEFVKEECAEEFKDVFEKCAPNGPHGPPHGPGPHMMDLVAVFKNVFGAGPDAAKSPECDAAIEDMKASCAPKDWATFDWSKCAAASKALADKCAKVPPGADANGNLEAKPSGNPDCDAAIADMSDACAKSDDPAAVYDWKKCSDASKKIAKACSKWGPKEPADVSALEAKPSGNPDCDAAIADMDAACAKSDDPAAVYDWSKCAKASKKIAKACSKWGPKKPAEEPENEPRGVSQARGCQVRRRAREDARRVRCARQGCQGCLPLRLEEVRRRLQGARRRVRQARPEARLAVQLFGVRGAGQADGERVRVRRSERTRQGGQVRRLHRRVREVRAIRRPPRASLPVSACMIHDACSREQLFLYSFAESATHANLLPL